VILTLIGVLLGAFDVMLIKENKKAEETQDDLKEKICQLDFEITRHQLMFDLLRAETNFSNYFSSKVTKREIALTSSNESIYVLWLPDPGCELCWEKMMNETIAGEIRKFANLWVLSDNPNLNDLKFFMRKFDFEDLFPVIQTEINIVDGRTTIPMIILLNQELEILDGIQIDLENQQYLLLWLENQGI